MGFSDDIRTIAKTAQLEEKIAKAVKDANDALKASITASRSMATQSGDNTKGIQTGAPGGGASIIATLPTGAQQAAPPNGTPVPDNHTGTSYNGSDSMSGSDAANAIDRLQNGNYTDLTSHASAGGNVGGSDALSLMQKGGTDSILNSLVAKMELDGVSASDIQKFRESYLAAKYPHDGEKTAKDIADNLFSSPQSSFSSDSELLYPGSALGKERLNSILGFDKDGTISPVTGAVAGIKVMLRGQYPTPTDADADAANQNPWADYHTPPIQRGYVAGSFWRINGGYSGAQITAQTFYDMLTQRKNRGAQNHAYALDGGSSISLVTSLNPQPSDGHVLFSTNGGGHIGDTAGSLGGTIYTLNSSGTVGSNQYGLEVCPGTGSAGTATCALAAPVETHWPATGVYVMLLAAGLFTGSALDSEVPFKYTTNQSALRVALGDGVNVIDDRYMDVELGVKGGYLVTTIDADGVTPLSANYYDSDGGLRASNIAPENLDYWRPRW